MKTKNLIKFTKFMLCSYVHIIYVSCSYSPGHNPLIFIPTRSRELVAGVRDAFTINQQPVMGIIKIFLQRHFFPSWNV